MAKVYYEDAWSEEERELKFDWVGPILTIHTSKNHTQHIELVLTPDEVKRLKEVLKI